MKNIHILPTDKPSRLISSGKEFNLLTKPVIDKRCKNIYITSDEEIKEGDWVINLKSNGVYPIFILNEVVDYEKKIILTTDQELIAEGVQAIDDSFLEWFVNNRNCEFVNIVPFDGYNAIKGKYFGYEIIIPKEEQVNHRQIGASEFVTKDFIKNIVIPKEKQKKIYEMPFAINDVDVIWRNNQEKQKKIYEMPFAINDFGKTCTINKEEPILIQSSIDGDVIWRNNQETLEEAANKFCIENRVQPNGIISNSFIKGAKWQQERSYSEKGVINLLKAFAPYIRYNYENLDVIRWFKEFKK